ncbi:unnamed protein product [Arabidopsis arenosa]|uniref:Uncharacterized protein n=1 Tax=Arabidopsis arenosa TaxID=38785 RepID=A0A8S1ZMT8_ARAAE|nr:unnamed protein product [Arabidopsis arenosa]
MEKAEEIDKKLDIEHDAEESSLNMILKSLWQISVFARQNKVRQRFTGSFLKEDILRLSFINNLSLSQPPEANNVFELFVYILENLPPWNPYFEVLLESGMVFSAFFENCIFDLRYYFLKIGSRCFPRRDLKTRVLFLSPIQDPD